ncbi:MAG TPA: 30S ribosome-binding factor RbfA [Nevskiaceae bacterium]
MPREYPRTLRLDAQLRNEIAELIRRECADPRLAGVTVSHARVTRDLREAEVFVSVLGDDARLAAALRALKGAAPRLRHLLGQRLRLRLLPALRFSADRALREGDRVAALIRRARESDAAAGRVDSPGTAGPDHDGS